MIYQENYVHGRLNNTCKVLVTMSLLIVTCNRLQYEGHSTAELRVKYHLPIKATCPNTSCFFFQTLVQRTGPLLPTLRYILSEVLLAVLIILEGFKAGGPAGGIMVLLLLFTLLGLGSIFSINHAIQTEADPEIIASHEGNV